ncbi:MAG: S1C family serine protease, partial [Candidatus Margulisbacteria bacterium]|nr:S1C family serine protease [Candidatus Margulisiibacteriota bacterium]
MTRKLANFLVFSLFCAAVAFAQSSPIDQGTIADIVQNEGDAVVNIDIIKNVRIRTSPFFNTNDFFGVMPEFRSFSRERIIPQRGAGSGFIIDKRGYIMTNEHVVRGAAEIIVTARNGKKYNGKIAGADPDLDIAIV